MIPQRIAVQAGIPNKRQKGMVGAKGMYAIPAILTIMSHIMKLPDSQKRTPAMATMTFVLYMETVPTINHAR